MTVAEQQVVNFGGVKIQLLTVQILIPPLEHATIQHQALASELYQMAGAGYSLYCTHKTNIQTITRFI